MNTTAEAWFAVIGVFVVVCVPVVALIALVNRIGHPRTPRRKVVTQEYPQARSHTPGGCWCGELHEGTPTRDGELAWRAS